MSDENQEQQAPSIEDRISKLESEVTAIESVKNSNTDLQSQFDKLTTQLHNNGIHFDPS